MMNIGAIIASQAAMQTAARMAINNSNKRREEQQKRGEKKENKQQMQDAAMDEQEAIEVLKVSKDIREQLPILAPVYDVAVKALEKRIPKKPIRNDLCTCPACGTYNEIVKKRRNTVAFDTVYCWHCGQAMEIKGE